MSVTAKECGFGGVVADFAGCARLSLVLVQARGVGFPRRVVSPAVKV